MSSTVIVHVDDDPNDLLLLEHACRKAELSCELIGLNDGDEAIAYLKGTAQFAEREKFPLPQLMLLDLKMPRLNGIEVLSWVRSQEQFRLLPVIILSSSNHAVDVRRAYEMGANSFLVKPVAFNTLVSIIKCVHDYWLVLNLASIPE